MTPAPDLRTEAIAAATAGLSVLPCRADGTKRPIGNAWKDAQAAPAPLSAVEGWYASDAPPRGLGVVCGAVSGHLEMLELDWPRSGEDRKATWTEFVARAADIGAGPLVERVVAGYAEATPSGGLHLLYRCPDGVEGNLKLARRLAADDELTDEERGLRERGGLVVRVLFETRGEGGYVVVAPTNGRCHPTGRPWVRRSGGFESIAVLSGEERAVLLEVARSFDELGDVEVVEPITSAQDKNLPTAPRSDGSWFDATVAAFNRATGWAQILEPHGWRHDGDRGGVGYWVRPGKAAKDGHGATTNANGTDRFILWSTSVAVPGLETASGASAPSYDRFSVWAAYEHRGDRQAAAVAARQAGHGPAWEESRSGGIDLDELVGRRPAAATPIEAVDAVWLPEELWEARPALAAIRDAARAQLVAPDAVLGAVLCRVAAITPHTVELPAIIGGAVGLTFYADLVGPPESGKSAAAAVAAALIPAPHDVPDRLPIGSGEGFAEILFEMVDEDDEKGKSRQVRRQTRFGAVFHIDEGAVLADLAGRSGSTLMPVLRTAFSHGTIGNANASVERRRILEGHRYVYGVTLGIQPELAGPLLGDTAAGTPQRFVWFTAIDPGAAPDAGTWPDETLWKPFEVHELDRLLPTVMRAGWKRHQLAVADEIRQEVKADRVAIMRGTLARDNADAHQVLVRLKVAALLALLDDRLEVEDSDWILAGVIVDTSRRVRVAMGSALGSAAARQEAERVARLVRQAGAVEESAETRALSSAARSIAKVVVRHHAEGDTGAHGHEASAGCVRRCCHAAIGGRVRALVSVDDGIAAAIEKGWVHPIEGRLHPGESRPA